MMLVFAAALASSLFVKLRRYTMLIATEPTMAIDLPALFLIAILLTAIALAAWKGHSVLLTMIQANLACLGWLSLIWIMEAGYERTTRYWFEAAFALVITFPLLARRAVKVSLPRGPRRAWWKNACESVSFSFLNMLLVTIGVLLQVLIYWVFWIIAESPLGAGLPRR